MKVHDFLVQTGRSSQESVTFADLIAITETGDQSATVDPVKAEKERKRAALQAEIDAL